VLLGQWPRFVIQNNVSKIGLSLHLQVKTYSLLIHLHKPLLRRTRC
jgi:hypothetical protein